MLQARQEGHGATHLTHIVPTQPLPAAQVPTQSLTAYTKIAASLSELRGALAALGISTSTGGLRGEERRLELAKRLQQAQGTHLILLPGQESGGSKTLASNAALEGENDDLNIDTYQHMALGDLRKELEERGQSTQTPGLKGDARRHALVQRLVNTHGQAPNRQEVQQSIQQSAGNDASPSLTGRESVSDGGDDADTKSVVSSSSSSYSAASEFLFLDFPSGRGAPDTSAGTKAKQRNEYKYQHSQVPALDLDRNNTTKKIKRPGTKSNQSSLFSVSSGEMDQSSRSGGDSSQQLELQIQLHDELFEKRKQLHQLRLNRHEAVEKSMREAGFAVSLDTLSLQLEKLEKERQRLIGNYFAHELVTSNVLSLSTSFDGVQTVELVQEDAIQLLDKLQDKLRKQVQQTKAALEIVKKRLEEEEDNNNNNNNMSSEADISSDAEVQLTAHIQQINELLCQQQKDSGRSVESRMPSWRSVASAASSSSSNSSNAVDSDPSLPMLTRCRSMPSAMFKNTWNELEPEQKQQLHRELRAAASFRIKSNRVSLGGHFGSLTSRLSQSTSVLGRPAAAPSQADRLGIKALFLEHTKRSVLETSRTYQQAIALDCDHAVNLGNYARFLYLVCGNLDLAQKHFQLALQADPLNPQNLVNYANFLKRARHNLDQAEKYYQQALRLAPNNVHVLGNYANLLMKKSGNSTYAKQARELLEIALRIAPDHIKNRLQYAAVLSALNDLSSAKCCYEQLACSIDRQRTATTKQQGGSSSSADKELAHVYGNYANFLRKREQWEMAKLMYVKALTLQPRHPLLLRNLYVLATAFGLLHVLEREQALFDPQVSDLGSGTICTITKEIKPPIALKCWNTRAAVQ